MNNRIMIPSLFAVLVFGLVLSGASCSQQSSVGVDSGMNNVVDSDGSPRPGSTTMAEQPNTVEGDIEAIVSSELDIANEEQAEIASSDAEDRASVTSESEAFGNVGVLGGEFAYE